MRAPVARASRAETHRNPDRLSRNRRRTSRCRNQRRSSAETACPRSRGWTRRPARGDPVDRSASARATNECRTGTPHRTGARCSCGYRRTEHGARCGRPRAEQRIDGGKVRNKRRVALFVDWVGKLLKRDPDTFSLKESDVEIFLGGLSTVVVGCAERLAHLQQPDVAIAFDPELARA